MASQPLPGPTPNGLEARFQRRDLQAEDLRLVVVNGVAYLDGAVASYQQKKAIGAAVATLPNVREVVNRLRVAPCSLRSDKEIAQNLIAALQKDAVLSLYSVGVAVKDGVVELKGHVSSISGKVAAEAAAWSVCGVRHVINRLEVAPEAALDPAELGLALKRSLQIYLGLPPTAIDVRIDQGAAYLTGTVASPHQRLIAEDLVRYHPLIRQVVNRLQVAEAGQPRPALSDLPPPA